MTNEHTLSHYEGFEKEKKYMEIWDKIRYKKVTSIEQRVKQIIEILERHIDGSLLVHKDYIEIQSVYRQMRRDTIFYMSGDAKSIICSVNPTYESVYTRRECIRLLRYIGEDDGSLTYGQTYVSKDFNGATYTIEKDDNGDERGCGSSYFERLDIVQSLSSEILALLESKNLNSEQFEIIHSLLNTRIYLHNITAHYELENLPTQNNSYFIYDEVKEILSYEGEWIVFQARSIESLKSQLKYPYNALGAITFYHFGGKIRLTEVVEWADIVNQGLHDDAMHILGYAEDDCSEDTEINATIVLTGVSKNKIL